MGKVQNTWMGDPPRIELLKAVLGEIKKENLLQLVQDSGHVLLEGLKNLQVSKSIIIIIMLANRLSLFLSISLAY